MIFAAGGNCQSRNRAACPAWSLGRPGGAFPFRRKCKMLHSKDSGLDLRYAAFRFRLTNSRTPSNYCSDSSSSGATSPFRTRSPRFPWSMKLTSGRENRRDQHHRFSGGKSFGWNTDGPGFARRSGRSSRSTCATCVFLFSVRAAERVALGLAMRLRKLRTLRAGEPHF